MKTKTLPTNPIERVFVHVAGDKSVGIRPADFELTLYYDVGRWTGDNHTALECLDELRDNIAALYEQMSGEKPVVMFDYENEHWLKNQDYPAQP